MSIRLNLLAEAQAAEDLRRRDPVKGALWLAALFIAMMLAWSSVLQLRATLASSEVTGIEAQMSARTNEFRQVLDNQKKVVEINSKLGALRQLAASRFLNGTLLNALQQTTVEDAQLIRVRVDQLYAKVEATKTHTNDQKQVIPGIPPRTTEKIVLHLEGQDLSPSAGEQFKFNRFKSVLTANAYFREMLTKTNPVNLASLSPPQVAAGTGKPYVTFNLSCSFPEKTR
jgi:hypothetical protein